VALPVRYKLFIYIFLFIVLLLLGGVFSFNYWIDPLWTFSHQHDYNDVQVVIDERQQKVNHLYYQSPAYDTLLIGSSRTTYINQEGFGDFSVYNFAASDLSFLEYEAMIDYFVEQNEENLERIIIGVDFFKSSVQESQNPVALKPYIDRVKAPFYRYKQLLSLDLLDYSRRNYRISKANNIALERNYNRDNIAFARQFEPSSIERQTDEKIDTFTSTFYGEHYMYNHEIKHVLERIKTRYPDIELIIFTTPIMTDLYQAMIDSGNKPDYDRWLKDLESVADQLIHFMYPNTITNDRMNYFDGHHFYPRVGSIIADVIYSRTPHDDFGIILK
jgi:hypothetical protein